MVDVIYWRNRIYVFDIEEAVSYSSSFGYWVRNDNSILSDYFSSLSDQLFKDDVKSHNRLNTILRDYNNISKIHIYLYPFTVSDTYDHDVSKDDRIQAFEDEAYKVRNLLPEIIKRNTMYVIDKLNTKIASIMKDYSRKRIRVVYHLNSENFFEADKAKNDSIYVYEIKRPEPLIKRKM